MNDVERLIHESMSRSLFNEVVADDEDIPDINIEPTDTDSEMEEI